MTNLIEHLLKQGEIAVIPTDTVYGVVARVADRQSVARLYKMKHRESKPGTLVAANIKQLVDIGIQHEYLTVVEHFWPGAISVIIPTDENLTYVHQGVGSLAVRIPDDKWLRELLLRTGPLLTSSANQPGEAPATTVAEAKAYFGNQVDWYEDGGVVNSQPSTVVQVEGDVVKILRQGTARLSN